MAHVVMDFDRLDLFPFIKGNRYEFSKEVQVHTCQPMLKVMEGPRILTQSGILRSIAVAIGEIRRVNQKNLRPLMSKV